MNNIQIIEKHYRDSIGGIQEAWLNESSENWYLHVIALSEKQKAAYLTMILNNQVNNGGFHQYFSNGYGQFAEETVKVLNEIGAQKQAKILAAAMKAVNIEGDRPEIFRRKLLKREMAQLFIGDDLFEPLSSLDDEYYKLDEEEFFSLVANYLEG
jgi:hypothetical protein